MHLRRYFLFGILLGNYSWSNDLLYCFLPLSPDLIIEKYIINGAELFNFSEFNSIFRNGVIFRKNLFITNERISLYVNPNRFDVG